MTVANEINRVKFVAEDFATYRSEADAFFQTYYPEDYNNLLATDLGNALMDQLAFAMQSLSFMINRRSSELFLSTARLNKSIVKLARMLGYPVKPAAPASCDLTVTFPDGPYSFPVTIPVGFQWQGPGEIIYEYRGTVDYVVSPGTTVFTIPIKEGQTRRVTFISSGEEGQQFSVFGIPEGEYMYSDDLLLTVDGDVWSRQNLITYESLNIFEILFADSPPKIRFGDGIAGNVPPESAQIVLSFIYGKGAAGSIAQNQITGAVNPIVVNGTTVNLELTNTVSNVGEDPEDIRHVRAFASTFFRTQNAAVVKQDYDSIAALETGVALADAQIMRGVSGDITIQGGFNSLIEGADLVVGAATTISSSTVTGTGSLGVSGINFLGVGNVSGLGVSGTSFLGCDVSGNVTGLSYLGVAGIAGLFVSGSPSLGVSGVGDLGIQSFAAISADAVSGAGLINSSVSGLYNYLSQVFSDTSKANNVQMILLSVDSNNKYISPSLATMTNVQATLDSLKDAVVTVNVVDGISRIIECDIEVDLGISQTAVISDVKLKSENALSQSITPFGLLVRREAGASLYKSDIVEAIDDANSEADIRFINVRITHPVSMLDDDGNLIISPQQIVQGRNVTVTVKKRFLISGEVVDV